MTEVDQLLNKMRETIGESKHTRIQEILILIKIVETLLPLAVNEEPLNEYLRFLIESDFEIAEVEGKLVLTEPPSNRKHLVGRVDGLKFEIFSNEHGRPHFRVKCKNPSFKTNFRIDDCSLESGEMPKRRIYEKIKYFWQNNRETMIRMWNEKRAIHDVVGLISDSEK